MAECECDGIRNGKGACYIQSSCKTELLIVSFGGPEKGRWGLDYEYDEI